MSPITNVTRLLDSRKIAYTLCELPAEKMSAQETARLLNVPPEIVFKTIVVTRAKPKKPILALIPGPREVDLKALAKFLGEKKVYLATQREAEALTGLQAGGISPLALLNKGFLVVLDASAQKQADTLRDAPGTGIHVSGGQRGLNIRLGVDDLVSLTRARVGDISR